jgi:DNA-binding HxlR family transcriptional regulator
LDIVSERRSYGKQDCSLAGALEIIGERWTLLVLRDCFYGVRRFNDFQAHLDIPRAVLTDRLKQLVATGLLERRKTPTGNEYRVTEAGVTLWPAIYAIAQWGEQRLAPQAGPRRLFSHVVCGTDIVATGMCPSCGTVPAAVELETRRGPGANRDLRDDPVSQALAVGSHRLLTPLLSAIPAAPAHSV